MSVRGGFCNGSLSYILPPDDETFPVNVTNSAAVGPESQKCT